MARSTRKNWSPVFCDARLEGALSQHPAGRLRIVLPAAYEDNNPVILFEHKGLYRRGRQPVAWNPNYRAVWQPKQLRQGDFATFVTYGEMVHLAEESCDYLAGEYETTFDLFDLRGLAPKLDAIKSSLTRTGRAVVLHEGRRTHGFGAELVARLTEEHLQRPESRTAPHRFDGYSCALRPRARARLPSDLKDAIIEKLVAWLG